MNKMIKFKNLKTAPYLFIALGLVSSFGFSSVAIALPASSAASSTSSASSTNNSARIQNIITRGNNEIARRLTTLNTLTGKLSSTTKLSSADQTSLSNQVASDISGLNSVKTNLDASTTLASAQSSAQSIFTEYRVYALLVPQVLLVKAADDQQVNEAKLSAMATKLSARLSSSSNTALTGDLATMNTDIAAAKSASSSVETNVIALTPSDYNSSHTVLSGYQGDLKTAQGDNQTALALAKTIVSSLSSSKS